MPQISYLIMKKYVFLFVCCLAGSISLFAQKQDFPKAWEGIWKGELQIMNVKGVQMQLPMELHILPIDSSKWTWKIVYAPKDKPRDERNYELIVKDKAKGHYAVDEKDGIILDAFYINGNLYSEFAVQGTEILSIDRLEGKNLVVEMIVKPSKEIAVTGGTSEEVPPVSSYQISSQHKAVLKKVKK